MIEQLKTKFKFNENPNFQLDGYTLLSYCFKNNLKLSPEQYQDLIEHSDTSTINKDGNTSLFCYLKSEVFLRQDLVEKMLDKTDVSYVAYHGYHIFSKLSIDKISINNYLSIVERINFEEFNHKVLKENHFTDLPFFDLVSFWLYNCPEFYPVVKACCEKQNFNILDDNDMTPLKWIPFHTPQINISSYFDNYSDLLQFIVDKTDFSLKKKHDKRYLYNSLFFEDMCNEYFNEVFSFDVLLNIYKKLPKQTVNEVKKTFGSVVPEYMEKKKKLIEQLDIGVEKDLINDKINLQNNKKVKNELIFKI